MKPNDTDRRLLLPEKTQYLVSLTKAESNVDMSMIRMTKVPIIKGRSLTGDLINDLHRKSGKH
jgi:hypothetical protein